MIYFNEERHEYRLDDPITGELCISGTTFIELFKNKFDLETWSFYDGLRLALGKEKKDFSSMICKYPYFFSFPAMKSRTTAQNIQVLAELGWKLGIPFNVIQEHQVMVKNTWARDNVKAQVKGTNFHNSQESNVYVDKGMNYDGVFASLNEKVTDLAALHNPDKLVVAPELRMYNREFKLSGTADMVFIYPNRQVDIDDWKTNKLIKMENKYDKMKGPVKHLDDCNYNHYRLQVSLYAWILEQYGYKPKNLRFTHVRINDNNEILERVEYHTNYMKKEVEGMLEFYSEHKAELLAQRKK